MAGKPACENESDVAVAAPAPTEKSGRGKHRSAIELWWDGLMGRGDEGGGRDEGRREGAANGKGGVVVGGGGKEDAGEDDEGQRESGGETDAGGPSAWWKKGTSGWGGGGPTSSSESRRSGFRRENSFASWLVPSDLLQAVDILNDTIAKSHVHGIVDVRGRYPPVAVFQSVFVLAKLQMARRLREASEDRALRPNGGGAGVGSAPPDSLLSDLVRYSAFSSAAYGWKPQVVFGGGVHGTDLAALLAKTGIGKGDVVSCRWESELHRPAYFLVRDHSRRSIVLCIRGTMTIKDVVTDLFFEEDGVLQDGDDWKLFTSGLGQGQMAPQIVGEECVDVRAHQGMVHSAREIARETRLFIEAELTAHPGYRLVLTGHSMGGGAAAILGSFWRNAFRDHNVVVYIFGCPCVSTLDSRLSREDNIFSVMREGDPFSTLSLGHVADLSQAIAALCEDEGMRGGAMKRLQFKNVRDLSREDTDWCCTLLSNLRKNFTAQKFYPCGQLYYISGANFKNLDMKKVQHDKFGEMLVHKDMTDLSRHYFSNYEKALLKLWGNRQVPIEYNSDT